MSDDKDRKRQRAEDRQERLTQALRQNLHRRKAQARARTDKGQDAKTAPGATGDKKGS